MKDTCKNCRFFEPRETLALSEHGLCRRYPPIPDAGYPVLHQSQWCGEHSVEIDLVSGDPPDEPYYPFKKSE